MAKATGTQRAADSHRATAALLAACLEAHQELLRGLSALRALEPEADEAVQAILTLRGVRVVCLSWELWASFVGADGDDPDRLLLDHASGELVRLGKEALFGRAAAQSPIQGCPEVRDSSLMHLLSSPGTGEQAGGGGRPQSAPRRRHVP